MQSKAFPISISPKFYAHQFSFLIVILSAMITRTSSAVGFFQGDLPGSISITCTLIYLVHGSILRAHSLIINNNDSCILFLPATQPIQQEINDELWRSSQRNPQDDLQLDPATGTIYSTSGLETMARYCRRWIQVREIAGAAPQRLYTKRRT